MLQLVDIMCLCMMVILLDALHKRVEIYDHHLAILAPICNNRLIIHRFNAIDAVLESHHALQLNLWLFIITHIVILTIFMVRLIVIFRFMQLLQLHQINLIFGALGCLSPCSQIHRIRVLIHLLVLFFLILQQFCPI